MTDKLSQIRERCDKANRGQFFVSELIADISYLLDRVAELETRERELVQATVDQYNAGKASAAGELDVVSRANDDAHRMVDKFSERITQLESRLAAAEELARAGEKMQKAKNAALGFPTNDAQRLVEEMIAAEDEFDKALSTFRGVK